MNREALDDWIGRYEAAWRRPGTQRLSELFTVDATYSPGPYEPLVRGLDAIERFWEDERTGPDEVFAISSEPVAVEGDTGVVRVEVRYGEPVVQAYLDLWIVVLDSDGRCTRFEEWPFWPGKGRTPSS